VKLAIQRTTKVLICIYLIATVGYGFIGYLNFMVTNYFVAMCYAAFTGAMLVSALYNGLLLGNYKQIDTLHETCGELLAHNAEMHDINLKLRRLIWGLEDERAKRAD